MATTGPTDRELWARVREGDPRAFEVLFERHVKAVYNYSFRLTAEWAAAEDLTSSVFLQAWQKRDSLQLTSIDHSLLPWLLGVATNIARNRQRRLDRLARALQRLWVRDRPNMVGDDFAELVGDERRMASLLELVRELPTEEREALALHAWADLTYAEIASALGIPIGTVRSRLARARERLTSSASRSPHIETPLTERREIS
jgi:RNA polymerase sigma factor (sigma-70 family)